MIPSGQEAMAAPHMHQSLHVLTVPYKTQNISSPSALSCTSTFHYTKGVEDTLSSIFIHQTYNLKVLVRYSVVVADAA